MHKYLFFIFAKLTSLNSFAKQVTGVPIWSLSPPAWCWTGRWSWNVGAPALKSLLTMEPRKRGSSSGRFAPPCDHSPPLLMPPILLGPVLKWISFPSFSVTLFCSWDSFPNLTAVPWRLRMSSFCSFFSPYFLLLSLGTTGLDQAQCLPCVYHILQAGAAGPPGLPPQELALSYIGWGSEHQELQVTALAVIAQLQQVKMEMSRICGRVDLS